MKKSGIVLISLLLAGSCIERINIPVPGSPSHILVIDGFITDQPGPYTVKLSSSMDIDDAAPLGYPVTVKKVTLFDNAGHSEVLQQSDRGIYQTLPNGMRGVVGREYFIRVETNDGKVIESLPDRMNPVGTVDSVYYEFESRQPEAAPTENGYRIFINAHDSQEGEHYLRWKFIGTYVVQTQPQYKLCEVSPCLALYCPLKCSGYSYVNGVLHEGYAFNPVTKKVEYVIGLSCTCCRCWISPREDKPRVNNGQISANGVYHKVEVGYVPVNYYTFFEKYRVEIQQMSLSRAAFDYWKAIQQQKESVGNLFQPVTGKIPTNLYETGKTMEVQGIFYASAITKKQIYLDKNTNRLDLRVPVDCFAREGPMGENCLLGFPGSYATNLRPADWID